MAFRFHRVFCSTPGSLDAECRAFLDVVAQVNEEIIGLGSLFVPVFLPVNLTNKPALQAVVDQNVEDCSFFVQVLEDTWGPPERNMEHEFQLACHCRDDAALPMKSVALFLKEPAKAEFRALAGGDSAHDFATLEEFRAGLLVQLREWSQAFAARPAAAPA